MNDHAGTSTTFYRACFSPTVFYNGVGFFQDTVNQLHDFAFQEKLSLTAFSTLYRKEIMIAIQLRFIIHKNSRYLII